MDSNVKKLDTLVRESSKILIVSHQGPDPDAISCTVFAYNLLKHNFPNKEIYANISYSELKDFSKLTDTSFISNISLKEALDKYKPDLLLTLDLAEMKLIDMYFDPKEIGDYRNKGMKLAMIDHHNIAEQERDLLINQQHNSCVETIYQAFVEFLEYKTYPGYQNDVLLGIMGDTGFFAWVENDIDHTFDLAKRLIKEGGNLDKIKSIVEGKSLLTVKIHAEYLKNLVSNGELSYSYISDEFKSQNPEISDAEFTTANKQFVYTYIKYVGNAQWGFTIKPKGKGLYSLSFRAVIGSINTSIFSKQLNGDGHKTSSGGLVKASSVQEAVNQVLDIINKYKEEAYANK